MNERELEWRKYKKAVRKSHWRKVVTVHERYVLDNNEWEILKELEALKNEVKFFEHKTLYHDLIASSEGRPSVEIIEQKMRRIKFFKNIPHFFHFKKNYLA